MEVHTDQPRIKILFLDDRSKRIHSAIEFFKGHDLTIVTNVFECLRFLSNEEWDYVYLDHDLGGREFVNPDDPTSGMEVIRYIEKTSWPFERKKPVFIIHSSNVFAATLMELSLARIGFKVERRRFVYDH